MGTGGRRLNASPSELDRTRHGNPNTPFAAAERIRDRCAKVGIPCIFYPLEGEGHGAWDAVYDGRNLGWLTLEFLHEHMPAGRDSG